MGRVSIGEVVVGGVVKEAFEVGKLYGVLSDVLAIDSTELGPKATTPDGVTSGTPHVVAGKKLGSSM